MKRQDGYSLIEVLIAIAITAVVLLTVITMFYMGRRNVYSGKEMTAASAVGTRILEDMSTMTALQIQNNFGLVDSPNPLATVKLEGLGIVNTVTSTAGAFGSAGGEESFPNSVLRNTSACTPGATKCPDPGGGITNYDSGGFLAKWYGLIVPGSDTNAVLANPVIGLVITPRNATNVKSGKVCTCPITTAQFYKIRAYISWQEGKSGTRRYAFFDTTRVNRGPFL